VLLKEFSVTVAVFSIHRLIYSFILGSLRHQLAWFRFPVAESNWLRQVFEQRIPNVSSWFPVRPTTLQWIRWKTCARLWLPPGGVESAPLSRGENRRSWSGLPNASLPAQRSWTGRDTGELEAGRRRDHRARRLQRREAQKTYP